MKIFKKKIDLTFLNNLINLNYSESEQSIETIFEGELIWEDPNRSKIYLYYDYCFYIKLLIEAINTLNLFLITPPKNINVTKSVIDYTSYLLYINDINESGYIYIFCNSIKLSSDYQNKNQALNFIFECQKTLEKNNYTKDRICYIKYQPKTILRTILPCFIENIYDIPKDSILWETPLLKETMANYYALKKYAEERGWL